MPLNLFLKMTTVIICNLLTVFPVVFGQLVNTIVILFNVRGNEDVLVLSPSQEHAPGGLEDEAVLGNGQDEEADS